jgi:hypothetical protein
MGKARMTENKKRTRAPDRQVDLSDPNRRAVLWDRLYSRVAQGPEQWEGTLCWNWTGARVTSPNGTKSYGLMAYYPAPSAMGTTHRLSYSLNCGEIPQGMVIAHRCHNSISPIAAAT